MKNKKAYLFYKNDKRKIIYEDKNMTIRLFFYNNAMKTCEDLLNQYMYINRMKYGCLADNMIMYIQDKDKN